MIQHQLYIDDAKHALTLIPASSIDLIITGPPYWNEVAYSGQFGQLSAINDYPTFLQAIAAIWQHCGQRLKPGGILAFWVHDLYRPDATDSLNHIALHADLIKTLPPNFVLRQISIWDRYLSRVRNYLPFQEGTKYQYIIIFQKEGKHPVNQNLISQGLREEFWKPIWRFKTTPKLLGSQWLFKILFKIIEPVSDKLSFLKKGGRLLLTDAYRFTEYKTTCPPEIAQRLIKRFSQVGDTVLDPFLGSGTTMKIADQLKRKCVGIEINPETIPTIFNKVGKDKITLIFSSNDLAT